MPIVRLYWGRLGRTSENLLLREVSRRAGLPRRMRDMQPLRLRHYQGLARASESRLPGDAVGASQQTTRMREPPHLRSRCLSLMPASRSARSSADCRDPFLMPGTRRRSASHRHRASVPPLASIRAWSISEFGLSRRCFERQTRSASDRKARRTNRPADRRYGSSGRAYM